MTLGLLDLQINHEKEEIWIFVLILLATILGWVLLEQTLR